MSDPFAPGAGSSLPVHVAPWSEAHAPARRPDAPHFNGGYGTRAHGSGDGGTISGIQMETPAPGVRNSDAERRKFAVTLADAVAEYLKTHAGIDLGKP